jgi:hypothetical protein
LAIFGISFAIAESRTFTVDLEAIEAVVVDRNTGAFSKNLVGADPGIFVTKIKRDSDWLSAVSGDVLLRIRLQGKGDGNITPKVTVAVLSYHPTGLHGPFAGIRYWREFDEQESQLTIGGKATITVFLEDVTCTNLIIAVNVGEREEGNWGSTAALPFKCIPDVPVVKAD